MQLASSPLTADMLDGNKQSGEFSYMKEIF